MSRKGKTLSDSVIEYCAHIGADRLLVQGSGGNVSWKDNDTLWVKASGTWLADAGQKEIFVPVDRPSLCQALDRRDFSVDPQALGSYSMRPSIETLLHAVMPQKIVVHLHPVEAVSRLVRASCADEIPILLGDEVSWELIDYHKPGAQLAKAVHQKIRQKSDTNLILLKNHGVIIGADLLEEVDSILRSMSKKLQTAPFRPANTGGGIQSPNSLDLGETGYRLCQEPELHGLAADRRLSARLNDSWALYPDHVVFLGPRAVCIKSMQDLESTCRKLSHRPPFIFVQDSGVIESRLTTPAQKAQLNFYLDVLTRQSEDAVLNPLSPEQVASLVNWEAEKYRIGLNQ